MLTIGFIGFGEAASNICLGLSDNKKVKTLAYDILLNDDMIRAQLEERALTCGATCVYSLADLASCSQILLSAVTSSVAQKVAESMSPYLNTSHIYVDLNAITPEAAKQISATVEKTGAIFVDGAMMGALKTDKHKVLILASGRGVDFLKSKVDPLGFHITYVGDEPGAASGNKLIRSIFTKGLAALLIETLVYANKLDYYDVVLNSILKTLSKEPSKLVTALVTGTMMHSTRRLGELSGSKEMLQQAGLDSKMIEATTEVLKKVESLGLDKSSITLEINAALEMLDSFE